jgi:hypothetical protein
VRHHEECGSTFASAGIKEAKVPSCGQAFSGQKVQVASRNANLRQTVLQAEVLWNKDTPVYSNDALAFLLHAKVPVLLESAERRLTSQLG